MQFHFFAGKYDGYYFLCKFDQRFFVGLLKDLFEVWVDDDFA